MIPAAKFRIITHSLAVSLGFAVVWAGMALDRSKTAATDAGPTARVSSKGIRGTVATESMSGAYPRMLRTLEARGLTNQERQDAAKLLLDEWALRDPVGLIRYLNETRDWSQELGRPTPPEALARSRPDLVLDLAMRQGWPGALRSLKSGDPETVAGLILNLPEERRGRHIKDLLREAQRKMAANGIPCPNPTDGYRQGEAESFVREGDLENFLTRFDSIRDAGIRRDLVRLLRDSLRNESPGDDLLAFIMRLPEEHRDDVAAGIAIYDTDRPNGRAALREWLGKLVDHGLTECANEKVPALLDGTDREDLEEVPAWLASLPDDDDHQLLIGGLVSRWFGDPGNLVLGIGRMPPGGTRDRVAITALKEMRGGESLALEYAVQVVALISNPVSRGEWTYHLESRKDPPGEAGE